VEADRGIEVRDLLDRTTQFVHERLGTRQLVQWDLLAAAVMPEPEHADVLTKLTNTRVGARIEPWPRC